MSRVSALENYLNQFFGKAAFDIASLHGDASFRRYFRVQAEQRTYVLMDAPPPENPKLFITVAKLLQKNGLTVPEIIHADLDQGFILLQDFGDRVYLNELTENTHTKLYQDACVALDRMQTIESSALPGFDAEFLKRQYGFFIDWYLNQHLQLAPTGVELKNLNTQFDLISSILLSQPQVFVHRDYHSRNLMIMDIGNPGILDFQDAMRGPITYDLVSLLQDCYISWPRSMTENYVLSFLKRKKELGQVEDAVSEETFLKWFDFAGLQRHLKNLGIFARLKYRDNKPHYIKDMSKPFFYSLEITQRYSDLQKLHEFLQTIRDRQDFFQKTTIDLKGDLSCVR